MIRVTVLALACLALSAAAYATPYVPPEVGMNLPSHDEEVWLKSAGPPGRFYDYDPLVRYEMCADFITTLQVSDTSAIQYGGMREGEHMLSVIQTDNTSESIWIWTHWYSLTSQDDYHDNIDAAWEYCMNNPAYDEEGGDDFVTGYYRVYNCGWALQAEMEYSQVYGDDSYSAYADSCASYLCHHPLDLYYPTGMYRKLNGMVQAWAVGNLYEYGVFAGNPEFVSTALVLAGTVKEWSEGNPNKFHWREWALGGGAVMWGVVNSYFAANPSGMETWVETYAPYLDTEVDSSQYQNAWRAWAALGQWTATEVLDSGVYGGYFKHLADTLVLNDGDNDGGIPVTDPEPDDQDQSWVTNYLGFMCMDKLIATSGVTAEVVPAAGVLRAEVTSVPSAGLPGLRFRLDEPSWVVVSVYDTAGRLIAASDGGRLGRGVHTLSLGCDPVGRSVAPGIYYYMLRAERKVARGKIVVLR